LYESVEPGGTGTEKLHARGATTRRGRSSVFVDGVEMEHATARRGERECHERESDVAVVGFSSASSHLA